VDTLMTVNMAPFTSMTHLTFSANCGTCNLTCTARRQDDELAAGYD